MGTKLTVPKVLYFSDKKLPLSIKALTNRFNKKLNFGWVTKDQDEIVDHFNIKKFPSLIVIKNGVKKPFVFTNKFEYKPLFEFLNIFSEQFVPNETGQTQEEKPWLFQAIPEMHEKSAKAVCLGQQKTQCVILFSPEEPSKETFD